jgi:hypothetical protein
MVVATRFFKKHVAAHNVHLWDKDRLTEKRVGILPLPCKYSKCRKEFPQDRLKLYINHLATTHKELDEK